MTRLDYTAAPHSWSINSLFRHADLDDRSPSQLIANTFLMLILWRISPALYLLLAGSHL